MNVWEPNSWADESASCEMRQWTLTISSWFSCRTLSLNNMNITQSLRNYCSWKGQDQQYWLNDINRDVSHKGRTREEIEMIIYTNEPPPQIHAYWDLHKHTRTPFTMDYNFFGFTCQQKGMYTLLTAHTYIPGWHKMLVMLITTEKMQKHMISLRQCSGKKKDIKLFLEATHTCHWCGFFEVTSLFLRSQEYHCRGSKGPLL